MLTKSIRVLILMLLPLMAYAQGGRVTSDPVVLSGSGRPVGGANIAVCSPIATTGATANGSLLVFTMASNPITAGYKAGATVLVAGFTGGDTVFNAGTLAGNVISGGDIILAVSATTITVSTSLTRVAVSNGTLLQMGSATVSCAGLAQLYTDASLSTTTTNPIQSDGLGNYGAGIAAGTYYVQIYGSGVTTTLRQIVVNNPSAFPGTVASPQVPYADAPNHLAGSNNMTYGPSAAVPNALNLNTTAADCTNADGAVLALTNSLGGVTTAYIQKCPNGSFYLNNDGSIIPNHGFFGFQIGGTAVGDIDLRAGSGGGSIYCNTFLNSGGSTLPAGSCDMEFPNSGVGSAKFQLHSGAPNFSTLQWDSLNGCVYLFVLTSTNKGGVCPPASGNPNLFNIPIATASPGQRLQSDGANPQILSWATTGVQCGTIVAGGACSNTLTQAEHCISGIATLGGGTSTITGISPAFTSSTSYTVITNDVTTIANPSKGVPASSSSITFTGTGTDNINFVACGG